MANGQDFDHPAVSQHAVGAVVKWFNPVKGFGFVQPNDGSPDAFLHISVLQEIGRRDLPEGAKIVCDLAQGRKGLQVAAINHVEDPPDSAPQPAMMGEAETSQLEGTVKFFNAEKGFGFVIPDDGSKDVFVSARTLQRIGLATLESNQRVRLSIRHGQKGPMAEHVEVL